MDNRENMGRAIRFEQPEHIPITFYINPAYWSHCNHEALQDLIAGHRLLFPDFKRHEPGFTPPFDLTQRKDAPYTDPWGCVWQTPEDGITGAVHEHPIDNWDAFDTFQPPNPDKTDGVFPIDWDAVCVAVREKQQKGEWTCGGLQHGHTFLRLQDLRGYTNVICDMAMEEPRLTALIEMIEHFNAGVLAHWLEMAPDIMRYPEDLGMQHGPMLSPDHFRKYIKPVYERLMQPARDRCIPVHMHSDGDIRMLADDLIDGGVDVLNLQDLVNGIDWIADNLAGRFAIELDIDRQSITRHGTPREIDALIREEVQKLGRPEGGLLLIYDLYPGVPLENAAAVMDAMERYAGYYS